MSRKIQHNVTTALIVVCLLAPIAVVMLTDWPYAPWFVIAGLFGAYRVWQMRRYLDEVEDFYERDDRRAAERQNRGTTIYVPLLDDSGTPLDPAAAERLLARARMMAGPRETVVGVERTPAEARKL